MKTEGDITASGTVLSESPCPVCSLFPPCADGALPCPLLKERNTLRAEVGYWRMMHGRAKDREALLKQENEELKAMLVALQAQVEAQEKVIEAAARAARQSSSAPFS